MLAAFVLTIPLEYHLTFYRLMAALVLLVSLSFDFSRNGLKY